MARGTVRWWPWTKEWVHPMDEIMNRLQSGGEPRTPSEVAIKRVLTYEKPRIRVKAISRKVETE